MSVVFIQGTDGADNVVMRQNPANSHQIEVENNGVIIGEFDKGPSLTGINVSLLGGDDSLSLGNTSSNGLDFFNIPVTYDGGEGTNSLVLNDSAAVFDDTYTITSNSVSRTSFGGISYTNTANLTLNGEIGSNIFNINSTNAATTLTINDTAGTNTFSLGNLDNLPGPIVVNGSNGGAVILNDQPSAVLPTYTITSNTVARNGFGGLTYNNVASVKLNTSSFAGAINVNSTNAGTILTINSSTGNKVYNVGAGDLSLVAGAVVIQGSNGDNISVNDGNSPVSSSFYTIDNLTLSRNLFGGLTYFGVSTLQLGTGPGNSVIDIQGTESGTAYTFDSASGTDVVNVGAGSNAIDSILGNVSLGNFGGTVSLNILDHASLGDKAYTLSPTSFTREGKGLIDLSGATAISITGSLGNDTYTLTGTPTAPIALGDAGGSDTMVGPNLASLWTILSSSRFKIGTLTTNSMESIAGGSANDTFEFNDGASLPGTLNGGAGTTNTIDESAFTTPITADYTTGMITGVGAFFLNINSLAGGTAANALKGPGTNSVFKITAGDSGSISGVTAFYKFGTLIGGTGNETFKFASSGVLSGSIFGGGGTNTLDYSVFTTQVSVDLATNTSSRITSGFSSIQRVIGGTNANNTLTGPEAATSYNLSGANAGSTSGGVSFSGFGNIVAGDADDTVAFGNAGSLTGSLNGSGGSNTIDESAKTSPVMATLSAGLISGVGTTYSNFLIFIGSATNFGVLTGPDTATTFNISETNGGTLGTTTFRNFWTLVGGAANDLFKFGYGGWLSGGIDGGGGENTIREDYSYMEVDLRTSSVTRVGSAFSNIKIFSGLSAFTSDRIFGPQYSTDFYIIGENTISANGMIFMYFGGIVAGRGNDNFIFSNGASLLRSIDGGEGTNTLDLSAYTTSIVAKMDLSTITGVKENYANIRSITGGTAANTLIGPVAGSTYTITGTNTAIVGSLTFSKFGTINGNAGADKFVFGPTAVITGTINGGGGNNTFDYSALTTQVNVNLATSAASRVLNPFSGIQNFLGSSFVGNQLTGPAAGAIFKVTAANTGNVAGETFSSFGRLIGGAGADSFTLSDGATLTGGIEGGAGSNWLDYHAYTTNVTVNLATRAATGLARAISNIGKVRGGSGDDTLTGNAQGNVLIGGPGNDNITGGSGRSLLIGGTGVDSVKGGSDDDIVIGVSTVFDGGSGNSNLWLDAILAEWKSTVNDYATRVSLIKNGGGLTGSAKFTLGTLVKDDLAANVLIGDAGLDWFFKGTNDTINDLGDGEQVN